MTRRRARGRPARALVGSLMLTGFLAAPGAAQAPGSVATVGLGWGSQKLTRVSELVPSHVVTAFVIQSFIRVFPDTDGRRADTSVRYWWSNGLSAGFTYSDTKHDSEAAVTVDGSSRSGSADLRYSIGAVGSQLRPFLAASVGYRDYEFNSGLPGLGGSTAGTLEVTASAWAFGWDGGVEFWPAAWLGLEASATYRGVMFGTASGVDLTRESAEAEGVSGTEWGWRIAAHAAPW